MKFGFPLIVMTMPVKQTRQKRRRTINLSCFFSIVTSEGFFSVERYFFQTLYLAGIVKSFRVAEATSANVKRG